MAELQYYLGCPLWSNRAWIGELFAEGAKPPDFLRQYSSVFNTVEGNTTFYSLPKPATVQKWQEATPPDFRFCFKFPRVVSHQLRLREASREVQTFLQRLAPLGERLGPFFLQLPPSFAGSELPALERFLKSLPSEFTYAVEARHPDFFDYTRAEEKFNEVLQTLGASRVIFDTRGLHTAAVPAGDYFTLDAKRRKPKVPVRFTTTNQHPFIRFVGDPVIENNELHLLQWASAIAKWLEEGKRPYIFMHAPDDFFAPRLAHFFHALLRKILPNLKPLSLWPSEKTQPAKEQLTLFPNADNSQPNRF